MARSNVGLPSVSVPVLSTIMVSTRRKFSIAEASRNKMPCVAALPVATMMDIGVAKPRAQGQAMISTETALISPYCQPWGPPSRPHAKKAVSAMPITTSTNQPATWSAMRCIGAFER